MNKNLKLFIFCSLVCTSLRAQPDLKSQFEALIKKSGVARGDLSLMVGAPKKSLFELNSEKKLIPASITKIATTAAVLDFFPPGFQIKTRLLTVEKGRIPNGVLKSPLYFKGGGDPTFVSETLWFLVNAFVRSGIQRIDGDLILDSSLFDDKPFDESRESVRVDRAYDAPVSALSFNWNASNFFIRPGLKSGDKAQVFADPVNPYVEIQGEPTTSEKKTHSLKIEKIKVQDQKEIYKISGDIPVGHAEVAIYKNIQKPELWAGINLIEFLKQRGIVFNGKIKLGKTPADTQVLAEAPSKPIDHIVQDMNKFSNNFVAEALTKLMATLDGKQGNIADGIQKIRLVLQKSGLKENEFTIDNPSGLTRENRFSALAMIKILTHLRNNFEVFPEFLGSLPIAGVDGTLKSRLKNTKGERWVRAKTGLLTGVVALAGFAGHDNGEVIPFVFIYNGSQDGSKVRQLFDQLSTLLVE